MASKLEVRRSLEHEGEWAVEMDGRNVVGFYGPDAQRMAERHRDELATLLGVADRPPAATGAPQSRVGR